MHAKARYLQGRRLSTLPEVSLIFQKLTVVERRASSTALKHEEELIEL